jgi:hypothetical protein
LVLANDRRLTTTFKGVQFFLCLAARGGNGNPEGQFQVSGFQFLVSKPEASKLKTESGRMQTK